MILGNFQNAYDAFKAAFENLGGSKKTVVFFTVQSTGQFNCAAIFGQDNYGLTLVTSTSPPTFAADFPQAISVSSIS